MVRPGDVLKLEIKMVKKRANMGIVETAALVDGKKACTAELMFIVEERTEKIQDERLISCYNFDVQTIRLTRIRRQIE